MLHYNTFSGFQGPNDGCRTKDHFVVGFYSKPFKNGQKPSFFDDKFSSDEMTDMELEEIKSMTGSNTLGYDDFIGRYYLHIHYSEYHLIYPVLNVMLKLGYKMQTMTCILPAFEPGVDKLVSSRGMEEKIIEWIWWQIKSYDINHIINDENAIKSIYFDPWNYETKEGLELCEMLRKKKGLPKLVIPSGGPKEIDHPDNLYKWDMFKDCDFETLQTSQKRKIEDDSKEGNKKKIVS